MELRDFIEFGIEKMPNKTAVELAKYLDQEQQIFDQPKPTDAVSPFLHAFRLRN